MITLSGNKWHLYEENKGEETSLEIKVATNNFFTLTYNNQANADCIE